MATGPLNGIRILEFTQIIAGSMGGQLLADLGAEMIKVEPPGGEPWRLNAQFMPFESKSYQELNRGKKSLAVDLTRPEGQAVIHRLAKDADAAVINYRPDVAARLRIDYETLRAIRPDIVYCDVTAFGREGPLADRPGYDVVVQAVSGLMASTAKLDDRGVPMLTPPAIADVTTGYAIAAGVCAALFHRAMTGQGQKVETSLLINALTVQVGGTWSFPSIPAADANQRKRLAELSESARAEGKSFAELVAARGAAIRPGGNIYYRAYLTRDGVIAIGALSASLREKVRQVLDVKHNRDEPGYDAFDPKQREIDLKLTAEVEEMIRARTTEYWEKTFEAGGVPVSRVNFVQDLIDHPQLVANDYVVELVHELSGPQRTAAPPWKMSVTPPAPQGASPPLGKHTDALLAAAGYSPQEIAGLRSSGVIR
jgi:formyl-CoA transferase